MLKTAKQADISSLGKTLLEAEGELGKSLEDRVKAFHRIPARELEGKNIPAEGTVYKKIDALDTWIKANKGERTDSVLRFVETGLPARDAQNEYDIALKAFSATMDPAIKVKTVYIYDKPAIHLSREGAELMLSESSLDPKNFKKYTDHSIFTGKVPELVPPAKSLPTEVAKAGENAANHSLTKVVETELKQSWLSKVWEHPAGKWGVVGGTVAVGAAIAYAIFRDKNKDTQQITPGRQL